MKRFVATTPNTQMGRLERVVFRAIRGGTANNQQRPSTALSSIGDSHHSDERSRANTELTRALSVLRSTGSEGRDFAQAQDTRLKAPETHGRQGSQEGNEDLPQLLVTSHDETGDDMAAEKTRPDTSLGTDALDDELRGGEGQAQAAMSESDYEVSISRRLHALLKASSTVAMLTARPLGIKPPPVLEVGNDKVCRRSH